MIDFTDTEKLAKLARIEVSREELEALSRELGTIITYVSQLPERKNTGGENTDVHKNAMREDVEPHESGLYSDTLLKASHRSEGGFIRVDKVLKQDVS